MYDELLNKLNIESFICTSNINWQLKFLFMLLYFYLACAHELPMCVVYTLDE